jgi:hypothetical protein
VVGGERSGFWSEPADLNGLVATSEQILSAGVESECANDFVLAWGQSVQLATWWGCFFNINTPCASGIRTPGFNLRIYEDAGGLPGSTIADVSVTSFVEESLGCQTGSMFPIFKWTANVGAYPGDGHYWFGAQMKDHFYPPQAGRLASGGVVGYGSVFKGSAFGYPDWTPLADIFGEALDFSQEFDCMICTGSADVEDPPARATAKASWGTIKGLYR